jgi:hypothetical protein
VKERPLNKRIIFALTLAFLSLLTIRRAESAMVGMSLEELVKQADLIVIGTVVSAESEFAQGKIYSFANIAVSSTLKGELTGNQDKVIVKFPGGKVGDVGMKVENSPAFKADENIIVFLKQIQNQPYYATVGSFQGKFIVRDNMVVRGNISVDQFVARIESILGSAR